MALYNASDSRRLAEAVDTTNQEHLSVDDENVFHDAYHEDVARLVHSPSFRRLGRKHQLLPNEDSDFVRTRASHSNEVAQIATLLGAHLNKKLEERGFQFSIKSDLLVFAGLAHDLGHPPFGHLGEQVLNDRMLDAGGFEGNAQTLRILTRTERRFSKARLASDDGEQFFVWDKGYGINPTCRAIASILKYSKRISVKDPDSAERKISARVDKGFYSSEARIVDTVIGSISRADIEDTRDFKTIEADIMDYADDIAYSIYDLEDSFKSGVLRPEDVLGLSADLLKKIASDVRIKITKKHFPRKAQEEVREIADSYAEAFDAEAVQYCLIDFFRPIEFQQVEEENKGYVAETIRYLASYKKFSLLCSNDQVRRNFTEAYIKRCVFESNIVVVEDNLPLSKVYVPLDVSILIEVLKRVNYYLVIKSSLISSGEKRSEGILVEIFDRLYLPGDEFLPRASDCPGYHLLPDETREELDELFTAAKMSPNRDIFERTEDEENCVRVNGLIDMRKACELAIYEFAPLMRGFDIYQILDQRDYLIRNAAASAIYRTMQRHDGEAKLKLLSAFNARRVGMKRMICDYIANMTDRSAREFYDKYIFTE